MSHEEEVLLLPGLPLVNRPGENPEPDLWTFEIETPNEGDSPTAMIDYVHPGDMKCVYDLLSIVVTGVLIEHSSRQTGTRYCMTRVGAASRRYNEI